MRLRIGTWNVEYAKVTEKNRLRVKRLQWADADVWVLTETHDRLDLQSEGYAAVSSAPTRDDEGRWVTIWTRFPVLAPIQTDDKERTTAAIVASSVGRCSYTAPFFRGTRIAAVRERRGTGRSTTGSSPSKAPSGSGCAGATPKPSWSWRAT